MAQLPTARDLGRRPDFRSRPQAPQDRSGVIMGEALQDFGSRIMSIGADLTEREDRFRYSTAKKNLLVADIKARRELQDIDDFETWETHYRESMTQAMDAAASELRSDADRAIFEQDAMLLVERGASEVARASFNRRVDSARATLAGGLDELRQTGLEATDPGTRADILRSAHDMIRSAQEENFITAVEAEEMRRGFAKDYALGSIEMMSSEEAIKVLSDDEHPLAQQIPADTRKKLLEQKKAEFEEERVRIEADKAVNAIMDRHEDRGDALAEARKITDPAVRDRAVADVNQRFNEISVIEQERHREALDTATDLVEETKSTKRIDPRVWNELSVQEKRSLEERARQLTAGIEPETNWDLYYAMVQMATTDPGRFRATPLNHLRSKLGEVEFKELVRLQQLAPDDPAYIGLRTSKQIVDAALEDLGISTAYLKSGEKRQKMSQRETRFRRTVDEKIQAFAAVTGKAPTPDDVQSIVDNVVMETVFLREIGSDPEIPAALLTQDELGRAYVPIENIPFDALQDIRNLASSQGRDVDEDTIEHAYAAFVAGDKSLFLQIISGR